MRLASITMENLPHVVPLCYVFHNNSIWIHAEGKRKRHQNFRHNSHVTVIIDQYIDSDWKQNQDIFITGTVLYHKASDSDAQQACKALQSKYIQYKTRLSVAFDMIELKPDTIRQ